MYQGINYEAKEILLISDDNCFLNKNNDVEVISSYPISITRNISIDDFLHNRKKPMYSQYHYIIIKDQYVDLVFPKINYYFAKKDFTLALIVDTKYKLENNYYINQLMNNSDYQTKFYDNDDKLVIVFRRD